MLYRSSPLRCSLHSSENRREDGKNILMYASRNLMHSLMDDALVDRFLIWVHPLVLGGGERLFPDDAKRTELELVDVTTLENGIAVLDLRRADA